MPSIVIPVMEIQKETVGRAQFIEALQVHLGILFYIILTPEMTSVIG